MEGPHLPMGFDSGLDDLLLDPSFYGLDVHGDMTGLSFNDEPMLWYPDSPNETASLGGVKSQSHHASTGGSLRSPTGSSLIFTPTSTQPDFQDGDGFVETESEEVSISPDSSNDNTGDYVYVSSVDGDSSRGTQRNRNRPIRSSRTSPQPDLSSRSPHPHPHPIPQSAGQHWHTSFTSTSSFSMDDNARQARYVSSAGMDLYPRASDELVSNVAGFDTPFAGPNQGLPFRALNSNAVSGPSFDNMATLSQQMAHMNRASNNTPGYMNNNFAQYQNAGTPFTGPVPPQFAAGLRTRDIFNNQHLRFMPQNATLPSNNFQLPNEVASQSQSNCPIVDPAHFVQTNFQQQSMAAHTNVRLAISSTKSPNTSRLNADELPVEAVNALANRPSGASNHPESSQRSGSSYVRDHADRVRKGGRSRNSHLSEKSRMKSSVMRRVGACWRCAMQRDPCDHGDPCSRCTMRSQRGQTYYFDCDRSKLPDFVHDFLPPSMTIMHQKQTIEDAVSSSVIAWDHDNGIDIYLSSGYGPPLRWKVYEFKPNGDELLYQMQFSHDHSTDKMVCLKAYAPPYGLLKIDTSDDAHMDAYLDQLMQPRVLYDFAWTFYEAESGSDERHLQAGVLDLMCQLYLKTKDDQLKLLLYDILRMLLITFIMGHTLTISRDTVPTVIANVRHSSKPTTLDQKFTSPKLANRQLKFFFAVLRNRIYEKLLKWQQQTLHTAGKKDQTWLPAFCVTLGFAMVLEEVQHLLFIQADAAVTRGTMKREEAERVAKNACERIDDRFKFLIGLFQCKYRDKKWGDNGSFGPATPEVKDLDSQMFLAEMRELIIERYDHLKARENITFSKENQCFFTSRLTAKFLLPFLNLPG